MVIFAAEALLIASVVCYVLLLHCGRFSASMT